MPEQAVGGREMSRRDRGESRQKVLADALHTEKQVSLELSKALQHYMMKVEMLERMVVGKDE